MTSPKSEIKHLYQWPSGALQIDFEANLPTAAWNDLTLVVGSKSIALSSLRGSTDNSANWTAAGLDWSEGDTVTLKLTVPEVVETGVWSGKLNVKEVATTPSAYGCSNGVTGAGCNSQLVFTDDDFTYDGTTYAFTSIVHSGSGSSLEISFNRNVQSLDQLLTLEAVAARLPSQAGRSAITCRGDGSTGPWTRGRRETRWTSGWSAPPLSATSARGTTVLGTRAPSARRASPPGPTPTAMTSRASTSSPRTRKATTSPLPFTPSTRKASPTRRSLSSPAPTPSPPAHSPSNRLPGQRSMAAPPTPSC